MEILNHIGHPDEVYALLKYKLAGCETTKSKCDFKSMTEDLTKCYRLLDKTSRSFAAVIKALDGELRDAVCIFYLVLRALDTVEDDMTIPIDIKTPMLNTFHTNLQNPDWCYLDSQDKDREVLEQFPVISSEFRKLKAVYQQVISDICAKMGAGMILYLNKAPCSMQDWNEYCHYVAGLVGIGLSQLFSGSRIEDKIVGQDTTLANSMGLFLQKTNIIRDYLEDVRQGREFWPKAAWSKYCTDLSDFEKPELRQDALKCLNELITDALQHIPDVFKYMGRIKNQSVFNFCAIPQVMAIATLERCYNNPDIFEKVVKIRKGEAVKMISNTRSMESIKSVMKYFCNKIKSRIPSKDPSAKKTKSIINYSLSLSKTEEEFVSIAAFLPLYVSMAMMVGAIVWQYGHSSYSISDKLSDH